MRTSTAFATVLLLCAMMLHGGTVEARTLPLFTVGIEGGFTGTIMHASVYPDGTVIIERQGGGRPARESHATVPLNRGAVTAAVRLAQHRQVFSLSKTAQDATFGADIPIVSLTVHTSRGDRSVHAMGTERSHAPGTGRLFPVWGIFYALAGYPTQFG